jgi:hypothetical protein
MPASGSRISAILVRKLYSITSNQAAIIAIEVALHA